MRVAAYPRILIALAVACCAFLLGCASPAQGLWPPSPSAPSQTIYVSLDTWHAMIAFPVTTEHSSRNTQHFEEWGYAERAWYLEGRQGLTGVMRALFWPTEGVVEVGHHERLWAARTRQPPSELFVFSLSAEGSQRLHRHLRTTIAKDESVATVGGSQFYPARRSYHLFHTCHQYAAHALQEAGLPVSAFWAFNRSSLAMQLRRAVRMAEAASGSSEPQLP